MAQRVTDRTVFAVVLASFTGITITTIVTTRILPYVDLPFHLAAVTVHKYMGNPANCFDAFYISTLILKPNVLHPLFCSLPIFPSIEFGNHVYVCLYAVLLPLVTYLVIRKLNGNGWYAILVFPLIHNYNLLWGFIGYSMAVPFILLVFYVSLSCFEMGRMRSWLVLSALLVLLFFLHAQGALLAVLLFGCCSLFHFRRSLTKFIQSLLVPLPTIAFIVTWWFFFSTEIDQNMPALLTDYYATQYLPLLASRPLQLVTLDLGLLFEGSYGTVTAVTFFVCLLVIPAWVVMCRRNSIRSVFSNSTSQLALVFVMVFLGGFFILPQQIPGQNLIYQRLSVLFLIGLIILGGLLCRQVRARAVKLVICLISLCYCLFWLDYYATFDHENRAFTRSVLPESGTSDRLAGLIYDYTYRGHPVYIHFPNYHVVWNHGIVTSTMIDYRFGTVRRQATLPALPPYNAWIAKSRGYDGRYNHLEYILVRGWLPAQAAQSLWHFSATSHSGSWTLYRRTTLP